MMGELRKVRKEKRVEVGDKEEEEGREGDMNGEKRQEHGEDRKLEKKEVRHN